MRRIAYFLIGALTETLTLLGGDLSTHFYAAFLHLTLGSSLRYGHIGR